MTEKLRSSHFTLISKFKIENFSVYLPASEGSSGENANEKKINFNLHAYNCLNFAAFCVLQLF